jgi:hypothetical protein
MVSLDIWTKTAKMPEYLKEKLKEIRQQRKKEDESIKR